MNSQKGVAYDLMSGTASGKETPGLPDVDAAKKEEKVVKPEVESEQPAGAIPTVTDIPSEAGAPEANKPAKPATSDSKPAVK